MVVVALSVVLSVAPAATVVAPRLSLILLWIAAARSLLMCAAECRTYAAGVSAIGGGGGGGCEVPSCCWLLQPLDSYSRAALQPYSNTVSFLDMAS